MNNKPLVQHEIEDALNKASNGLSLEEINKQIDFGSAGHLKKLLNIMCANGQIMKTRIGKDKHYNPLFVYSFKGRYSFKNLIPDDLLFIHTKVFKRPANIIYPLKLK